MVNEQTRDFEQKQALPVELLSEQYMEIVQYKDLQRLFLVDYLSDK